MSISLDVEAWPKLICVQDKQRVEGGVSTHYSTHRNMKGQTPRVFLGWEHEIC